MAGSLYYSSVRLIIGLFVLIEFVNCCSVVSYRHHSMQEILNKAEMVVYGKESQRFSYTDNLGGKWQDAYFTVYCVLKSESLIASNITIREVDPRHSCSGTKVTTGKDYILALKKKGDDYEWDEVNVTPNGAAFLATDAVIKEAVRTCGLTKPKAPEGASSSKCPPAHDGQCEVTAGSESHFTVTTVLVLLFSALHLF